MLNKTNLKNDIAQAFIDQRTKDTDPNAAAEDLAGKISDAVETYVKSLLITYSSGLATASGGGPVTGTFTYTLS